MKHFLKEWSHIEQKMEGQVLVLCFDYDGTLTSIMDTPDQATLSQENKQLLEQLSKLCTVGIVSGRALEDLKAKINLKNIVYIGNHGLEINGPQLKFESMSPPTEKALFDYLRNKLSAELSVVPGAWVEDKGLTLSVHYRLADAKDEPVIRKIFLKVCSPYVVTHKIRLTEGKLVLEIRPFIDWDKGKALLWLLAKERKMRGHARVLPVFLGDDKTDEDALAAISKTGLGVVVGINRSSKATYFLRNTDEVTEFLKRIHMYLTHRS
ncbi:MAG: trehalose-phosphatase [Candidatus Omnitrophica bacterium]|nr:trehalose-phosphatase [Candidatus Omnitrophota bacterium]